MENIFNAIITKVNYRRKALGSEFDGLAYWHAMNAVLARLHPPVGITGGTSENMTDSYPWALRLDVEDEEDFEVIMQLPEHDEDGTIIIKNHCLKQLIRIPRTSPCTISNVLQIAFNIGQFTALNDYSYARLVELGLSSICDFIDADVENLMDQTVNANPILINELLSL